MMWRDSPVAYASDLRSRESYLMEKRRWRYWLAKEVDTFPIV